MWHQRLYRAVYGLVAVMVIAGSLGLVGCSDDDDDEVTVQRVPLDGANTRASVNSTNLPILANRDIEIDAAAFAFDALTAPGSSILTIFNIRPVVTVAGTPPVVTGPAPTFPVFAPPLSTVAITGTGVPAGRTFGNVACPSTAFPAVGSATNPLALAGAANPTAVADYSITRDDGTEFAGTLCIGAGTTSVPGATSPPGQGGNICVFTNFLDPSLTSLPGAQAIYTSCRIVVSTKPASQSGGTFTGVPVGGSIAGNLQFTITNQRSNVAFTSTPANEATIALTNNGNNTGSVFVTDTAGTLIDTTIDVDLQP